MTFPTLVEIVSAVHLGRYVVGPFKGRGGLMLVAPAGQLKSTAIEMLDLYPDCKIISDINIRTLIELKDDFIGGQIQTLAFSDFEKIYKRNSDTASNLEGVLMGLAEEGFRKASFQDQRMVSQPARCTIIGAMTIKCYELHYTSWSDNGFSRRFLFAHYSVKNIEKLEHAIRKWQRADITGKTFSARIPGSREIKFRMTPEQSKLIDLGLKHQKSRLLPRMTLQRIVSVLNWKFGASIATHHLEEFLPALRPDGAVLVL